KPYPWACYRLLATAALLIFGRINGFRDPIALRLSDRRSIWVERGLLISLIGNTEGGMPRKAMKFLCLVMLS
ncbi:hypothetical protein V2J09_017948, partial [Rumex salicifolius]